MEGHKIRNNEKHGSFRTQGWCKSRVSQHRTPPVNVSLSFPSINLFSSFLIDINGSCGRHMTAKSNQLMLCKPAPTSVFIKFYSKSLNSLLRVLLCLFTHRNYYFHPRYMQTFSLNLQSRRTHHRLQKYIPSCAEMMTVGIGYLEGTVWAQYNK